MGRIYVRFISNLTHEPFFFIAKVGLAATHLGIILAHIIIGTPFVVITVTATF